MLSGLHPLAGLLLACLLLSPISSATPSINLSKKSGPPTSRILVSGRGFEPNVGVDIFFDTKDKALVVTNAKGEFHDSRIYAPRSARPGEHWVTALERNNDKGAQRSFLVQTDWSQFHFDSDGTRLNPHENVLNPRTAGSLSVKWSYNTYDAVYSSPAVANGVVYIGSHNGYVYALDARTGAKLWEYLTDGHVASSPAVGDGVVFIGSENGTMYALKARTGKLLWSHGIAFDAFSEPTLADGIVYIGSGDPDYSVHALNARTGKQLWSYHTGSYITSSPAIANGVVYVGSWDNNVYAFNAQTGALLWSYATSSYVGGSPAIADGVVYVGSDDNVYALNAQTGAKLWSYVTGGYVFSSPALPRGHRC
jgi:outer membrane protein assembly factor BamB